MTIKSNLSIMPKLFGIGLSHAMREKAVAAARSRKRRPEEGGLLIEVLVGMLILVIVFTATTIALSSMADQRVQIEQRDQALSLLTTYEEQSRIFRCGYVVDRIDDDLSKINNGNLELTNRLAACDFKAKETGGPAVNSGDQDFPVSRVINEVSSERSFNVSIRYWWEVPGSLVHRDTCNAIRNAGTLPVILTRAFKITWKEKGLTRTETLIKRDPAPNDDVVFASGNRKNILVDVSLLADPNIRLQLNASGTQGVNKIIDGQLGQPTQCAWFPYITPDDLDRSISGDLSGTVRFEDVRDVAPQGSVIF